MQRPDHQIWYCASGPERITPPNCKYCLEYSSDNICQAKQNGDYKTTYSYITALMANLKQWFWYFYYMATWVEYSISGISAGWLDWQKTICLTQVKNAYYNQHLKLFFRLCPAYDFYCWWNLYNYSKLQIFFIIHIIIHNT